MAKMTKIISSEKAKHSRIVSKISALALKLGSKTLKPHIKAFVKQYFSHLVLDEIQAHDPEDLAKLAVHHLKTGRTRKNKKTLVRVFNPDEQTDGWEMGHTVVEVINNDTPFLVDSITAEINSQGLGVHLAIHPIMRVRRTKKGVLSGVVEPGALGSDVDIQGESFIHIQIDEQPTSAHAAIAKGLEDALNEVRLAVRDWRTMRNGLGELIDELETLTATISLDEISEVRDFLRWIHDDNFTFLGYREYKFVGKGPKAHAVVLKDSGLGILSDPDRVALDMRTMGKMPPEVRAFLGNDDLLVVMKSNIKSKVHRPVYMDSIGIKHLDNKGRVIGQRVFFGLFTAAAYQRSVRDIPLLRRKLQKAFDAAGLASNSHAGKTLLNILETFPRDELFQSSDQQLLETSLGILRLQDRQRLALFVRRDDFERFMSCLIYLPRDRYTTDLRCKIQDVLSKAFNGHVVSHYATLGDDPLARLHLVIKTKPGNIPKYDRSRLEATLTDLAQSWTDRLRGVLVEAHGEMEGMRLLESYKNAFERGYADHYDSLQTLDDINRIEPTYNYGRLGLNLYEQNAQDGPPMRFKIYHPRHSAALSDVLPMLEDLGLRVIEEIPYKVRPKDSEYKIVIHDFGLEPRGQLQGTAHDIRHHFHQAFDHIWAGNMESDSLNALILVAGLSWREVTILRAYTKYLRQAGIAFSEDYMSLTLRENGAVTRAIIDLFCARFDPVAQVTAARKVTRLSKKIESLLEDVSSADEDKILRRFVNLVNATLRTNFYQIDADGHPKAWLSFKLSSQDVDDLPLPRPKFEIFVYSADVEGVHLRFGKVARGGLRWSDRREDFRTEVLGLVKAQQVKNAVIVPVGSKGGFVMKNPPAAEEGRDAFINAGISCYKTFIRGLLDLTDNLDSKGGIIPPKDVVRLDGDDPYLVVAADKGTATFSDIANSVSLEYEFWLGDAFASGGSVGYDHKKMGITAKGAWESVKRHFREMGVDTQNEDFTVAGVGDMSGDVFGNGMLLSAHICLQAAFNHMHIFIDPKPDAAKSLKERQRLFDMPRSSWTDYNAKLISKGGGVFDRSAKSIKMSAEMKKLFGVTADKLTPNDLMTLILKKDVDLLWFGGIGTYIKSSTETHADAGDRANDAIRIDGLDVRAKVLGEGANLGTTQRSRVEFALNGGRLNTDSIDNSAGVDCSDHEVNIKILLDVEVQHKRLTPKARNTLLASMTDEVGKLVLWDNYEQTQAISMIQARGVDQADNQIRLMRMLERLNRLNREVEFLPDDETLTERMAQGLGLTRPEVSVLMSYAKLWLFDELMASDLPDDDLLTQDLTRYFPTPLHKKYAKGISEHRLRREIVATRVTNSMINRVGGTFVTQVAEKTGMETAEIARAFIVTRESFGVRSLWAHIESLDNKVPASIQTAMFLAINILVERGAVWMLRNGDTPINMENTVARFQDGIVSLAAGLDVVLPPDNQVDHQKRAQVYRDQGVPKNLSLAVAGLTYLESGGDIVVLAEQRKLKVCEVAKLYYAVGLKFRLGELRSACEALTGSTHWQKLAVSALVEELFSHQVLLTGHVLDKAKSNKDLSKAMDAWLGDHGEAIERTQQLLVELWAADITDISMVAVASRAFKSLADECANRCS